MFLESALLRRAGFRHGFSTRVGGVSGSGACPFSTLDFGVQDAKENVEENVRRLARAIGFDASRLYQASQEHSARVERAAGDPASVRAREADALVAFASAEPVAVGVRTADCTPVLVGDRESGAVVAIHAGWRGVVRGVIAAGVRALEAKSPSSLVAAIGPCIEVCCFEVGDDVAAEIASACGDASVVHRDRGSKPHVDMRRAPRAQLRALGIDDARIEDVAGCTKCDASRFFSYRRDGARSGRHISVIVSR